jgi:excisionase family DNA binding protein
MLKEPMMSVEELSAYLGVPIPTLYRWRSRGEGPHGIRIGRHVRYHRAAVRAWLAERAESEAS